MEQNFTEGTVGEVGDSRLGYRNRLRPLGHGIYL